MARLSPIFGGRGRAALLAPAVGVAGAGLVIAGVFVPWMAYYAGLYILSGAGTTNGNRFLAGGVAGLLLALGSLVGRRPVVRWLMAGLGGALVVLSGYVLVQLHVALSGADAMVIPQIRPGVFLIGGGSLLLFLTIFLPQVAPTTPAGSLIRAGTTTRGATLLPRAARWAGELTWQRGLQLALGTIWLTDAALQLQPYMFTRAFATTTLVPVAAGNPRGVAAAITGVAHLVAAHPALWNEAFAVTQLLIAVGILWRRTVRWALAGSVAWALGVWVVGEGLGGVLVAHTTPFMGAPGAALVYALIAVLIWPRRASSEGGGSLAERSALGRWGARSLWVALFALLGYESIPRPGTAAATSAMLRGMAGGEPGWLARIDSWAANLFAAHGTAVLAGSAAVFGVLAVAVLLPRVRRGMVISALVVASALWVIENFGGVATGSATDVNSAPLIALLALCFWPVHGPVGRRAVTGVDVGRALPVARVVEDTADLREPVAARA